MSWKRKWVSGLIATGVLTLAMVVQPIVYPSVALAMPSWWHRLIGGPEISGWLLHYAVGVMAWVLLFEFGYRLWPGESAPIKGLSFGMVLFVAMAFLFMPLVGLGFGGVALGWPLLAAAFVGHLIYGAVLGISYRLLSR